MKIEFSKDNAWKWELGGCGLLMLAALMCDPAGALVGCIAGATAAVVSVRRREDTKDDKP